jgi:hypothetical protein
MTCTPTGCSGARPGPGVPSGALVSGLRVAELVRRIRERSTTEFFCQVRSIASYLVNCVTTFREDFLSHNLSGAREYFHVPI